MMRNPYGGSGRHVVVKAVVAVLFIAYFGNDLVAMLQPLAEWIVGLATTALIFAFVMKRFRR